MNTFWWITFLVSMAVFAGGLWHGLAQHRWLKQATFTHGTVIELVSKKGHKGRTTVAPKVEFTDADGAKHTFVSSVASSPPAYALQEKVPVAYDPNQPESAAIATFGSRYGLSVVLVSLGLCGMLLSSCFLIGPRYVPAIYFSPADEFTMHDQSFKE